MNRSKHTGSQYPNKGRIIFFHRNKWFDGNTLNERPLGGMETSIICMARELTKLGWEVKVFNHCKKPGTYDGVEYVYVEEINDYKEKNEIDVFISVRYLEPFLADLNSKLRVLWTGDAFDQPFLEKLSNPVILKNIDRFFAKSRWQADTTAKHYNFPVDKFFIAKNGINVENFSDVSAERYKGKLVYASTPFRGLDFLLDMFPKIKSQVPYAELYIFSGMAVYGKSREEDYKRFKPLYDKADQPGVHLIGNVLQKELAKELMSSSLMVYPCTFMETLAGVTLEAMAAGVPVITTHDYALPEFIENNERGILIEGNPRHSDYQEKFIQAVISLLGDHEKRHRFSKNARQWAFTHYSRKQAALEWEAEFFKCLNEKQARIIAAKPEIKLQELLIKIENSPNNWQLYLEVASLCNTLGRLNEASFFKQRADEIRQ